MSRLQELIDELCPDGVEYRVLGEIGEFYGGLTGKSKKDFGEGAKFVTYNNVYGNPAINLDEYELVNVGPNERQNTVELGDVIFTISSENREEAGLTSVMTVDPGEPWYLNSFCTGWRMQDKSLLLPDFLKHVLRGPEVRQAISRTANGVTRFNISKPKLARVRIPVPPIEVQREVVRILDEYTAAHDELVRQLEEEVSLRDNQCQQAHDKTIYDAIVHTETTNLGSICLITDGDHQPPPKVDDGIPFVTISCIDKNRTIDYSLANAVSNKYYNSLDSERKPRQGDVLMTVVGTLGVPVRIEDDKPFAIQRHIAILRPLEQVHQGFLYHYIRYTDFHDSAVRAATGSAQKTIGLKYLRSARFPKLTYMEQESLAHRLDNIEESFASMKESLCSEIDCLDQQLQLVRNQLLSFPEKAA